MEDTKYIKYIVTKECVPIMLEAFRSGVSFSVSLNDLRGNPVYVEFIGKIYSYSRKDNMYHVRVTNDERRKILPILKKLNEKLKT